MKTSSSNAAASTDFRPAPPLRAVPVRRPHLWLLTLPFVWQLGMAPVINSVALTPLGLPFPLLWQMLGIVFSSLIFALVFHLDRAAGLEREEMRDVDGTVSAPAAGGKR